MNMNMIMNRATLLLLSLW